MKLKRIYGGWSISGRRRYATVKWLHPGVRAFRSTSVPLQVQVGRLLVRVSWRLVRCGPCCQRRHYANELT